MLWWTCPRCQQRVDLLQQLSEVFDEEGEADFDPRYGLLFHTIICECGNHWVVSISEPTRIK